MLEEASSTLGARIRSIRKRLREDQETFGLRFGVKRSAIHSYESDVTEPPISRLKDIATLAGKSVDWLVYGAEDGRPGEREYGGWVYVPRYGEVAASAGPGGIAEGERMTGVVAFAKAWVRRELGADPSKLVVLPMVGDSMEPLLSSGDLLLVDTAEESKRGEGVFVLRVDSDLLVKKVERTPGVIHVVSLKPGARSFDVRLDEAANVDLVGRVIWAGKKIA